MHPVRASMVVEIPYMIYWRWAFSCKVEGRGNVGLLPCCPGTDPMHVTRPSCSPWSDSLSSVLHFQFICSLTLITRTVTQQNFIGKGGNSTLNCCRGTQTASPPTKRPHLSWVISLNSSGTPPFTVTPALWLGKPTTPSLTAMQESQKGTNVQWRFLPS